jgi:hypothetical protein
MQLKFLDWENSLFLAVRASLPRSVEELMALSNGYFPVCRFDTRTRAGDQIQ